MVFLYLIAFILNMFFFGKSQSKFKQTLQKTTKIKHVLTRAIDSIKYQSRQNSNKSVEAIKRRSDQSSQSETLHEVLKNMQKGYIMIKHSVNTNEPHPKFIYLSKDYKQLCWKSPGKQDQKSIDIWSIKNVIKEGSQFYMKACEGVQNVNCCVFIDSSSRSLQLQAKHEYQAVIFRQELMRIMKYMQRMNFHYKYTNI